MKQRQVGEVNSLSVILVWLGVDRMRWSGGYEHADEDVYEHSVDMMKSMMIDLEIRVLDIGQYTNLSVSKCI